MESLKRLYTWDHQIKQGTCFVLMPFRDRFNELYHNAIKPIVEAQGLICLRADEIYTDRTIMGDIWNHIQQSEIIIADITDRNPNVLYELGLAHAIWRKTILITQQMSDIPFDLRQLRIIPYSDKIGAEAELSRELKKAINVLEEVGINDPALTLKSEFTKNHIYCGKNIRESEFNLTSMIERTSRLLILAGPNLYAVLSNSEYIQGLLDLVRRKITVQLIIGDRASLKVFGPTAERDLEKSARTILSLKREKLSAELQEYFQVFAHPSTITLSAVISDPNSDKGVLTFTPRWLNDYNPNVRLFCVLEKSKHPELFSVIYSDSFMLMLSNSQTIEQVVKDFDENP